MSIESKRAVAIGNANIMESLCHTCAYAGCTSCPSLVPVRGRNEKIEDFPQVLEGEERPNGTIRVDRCKDARERLKEKIKNKKPETVWNMHTRKWEIKK